jgi:hypothetical protein
MWDSLDLILDLLVQTAAGGSRPFYACFLLSLAAAALVFFVIPEHLLLRILLSIGLVTLGCISGVIWETAKRRR